MQLFKHMEVVLMCVFGIVCATVAFTPARTMHPVVAAAPVPAAFSGDIGDGAGMSAMPTVHVVGRRLAQPETAASLPAHAAVIATPKTAWAMHAH